jgi:putative intracellular protease/amidase
MIVAILLYEGLTVLDAIGPYEVFARFPDVQVRFVTETGAPVRADTGALTLTAEARLEDVPHPEIFIIPGGSDGTLAAMQNERILNWVRTAHTTSRWTTSVCTGAGILGAAGLLQGLRATTHWGSREALAGFGATYVPERYVQDGKIITAAGVSAGIDMALFLAGEVVGKQWAEASQLALEYDPHPPFSSGSLATATEETVNLTRQLFQQSAAQPE